MKEKLKEIQTLLEPIAQGLGLLYVGAEYLPGSEEVLLRIYLDKVGGIHIDDCATASRQMNATLIVEDILPERYRLEVSSPGIERPLFTKAHYEAALGQKIECRLSQLIHGRRKWTGIVASVKEDHFELVAEGVTVSLPLAEVTKANLKPEIKVGG